ncbi:hypothetical protein NE237_023807 [Protea cynaroides]|uniref:Complex 1 LYR protein domain-containing protein n=1 Tax=Protea cynaroides TaxID=273540 RepID=A0A9Q0HCT7_9MAGN|nr:hypothetical protein NE237_023807 [Protea cynaroides]
MDPLLAALQPCREYSTAYSPRPKLNPNFSRISPAFLPHNLRLQHSQLGLHSFRERLSRCKAKKGGMGFEAMQAAQVYRRLLKAVEKHIGKEDYKKHFRDFITQEFRKRSKLQDSLAAQQKIKLAHDYTYLLNSVHHQMDLLFSYNIAVDRTDEMKRILGKSAASVGLQLPDTYQP